MDTLTRNFTATVILLIGTGFLMGPSSATAQNPADQLYLGVEGGLAQSQFTGDGTDASSHQGGSAGVNAMYNINGALSVELKALYTRRGADGVTASAKPGTSSPAFNLSDDDFTLDYFHFPLLVKLTAPIEAVRIRALGGPAISFLDGATKNGNEIRRNFEAELPAKDRFKFYDLSGVVGGEIAVPLPGLLDGEVAVEGRYTFGFPNIDNRPGFDVSTQSLSGALTVRFPL